MGSMENSRLRRTFVHHSYTRLNPGFTHGEKQLDNRHILSTAAMSKLYPLSRQGTLVGH